MFEKWKRVWYFDIHHVYVSITGFNFVIILNIGGFIKRSTGAIATRTCKNAWIEPWFKNQTSDSCTREGPSPGML